jgi:hypothetical protein
MRRMQLWLPPLLGAVVYPGLMVAGEWALTGYERSDSGLFATCFLLAMLLALSVPALALRALLLVRDAERSVQERGVLYLAFSIPSLFSLTYTITRIAGVHEHVGAIWGSAWVALGVMLYLRQGRKTPISSETDVRWLRVIHGTTALFVLCGFLIAHLINHDLAVWSVELHRDAMNWLRLWYRSDWIEPVLLGLLVVMIGTGVPMVMHYARRRMDAFRVIQTATGVYIAVFLFSHVLATLRARSLGVETDWSFAAGPVSLLEPGGLLDRLIPHYFLGAISLMLHVACGLRVVLLQHGVAKIAGNRVLYALGGVAVLVTALIMAALLGFHVRR